jgi:hypothetical protein
MLTGGINFFERRPCRPLSFGHWISNKSIQLYMFLGGIYPWVESNSPWQGEFDSRGPARFDVIQDSKSPSTKNSRTTYVPVIPSRRIATGTAALQYI